MFDASTLSLGWPFGTPVTLELLFAYLNSPIVKAEPLVVRLMDIFCGSNVLILTSPCVN